MITQDEILALPEYEQQRKTFRKVAMERRKALRFYFKPHVLFCFEDNVTIHYQIQEMIRSEQLTTKEAIQDELDVYNPLITDSSDWKATLMFCFDDSIRAESLKALRQVEDTFSLVVGNERTAMIANEDLQRSNEEKTSAVHFVRFPIKTRTKDKTIDTDSCYIECNHPMLTHREKIPAAIIEHLMKTENKSE